MRQHLRNSLWVAVLHAGMLGVVLMLSRESWAGEIQSLLQRGLPTAIDPTADVRAAARQAAFPLRPIDRVPFYGLPYDLVDTTTGRLAFRVEDMTLPGRMPLVMSRFYDSGGTDIPNPLPDVDPRSGSDLGPFWSLSYTDYIQATSEGLVLVPAEGGPILFVPEDTGGQNPEPTYIKARSFPSNHLRLQQLDEQTLVETRADGTTWQFYQPSPDGYYLLDQITDRHGNYIVLNYMGDVLAWIQNSSGYWVQLNRMNLNPDLNCPPCPLRDEGCRRAQLECYKPPPITRVESMTDSIGRSVSFSYGEPYRQLISWTDIPGHTWQITTTEVGGRIESLTDPEQRLILTASYDNEKGQLHSYGIGSGVTYFSYSAGQTTVLDPRGNTWRYTSNQDGITVGVLGPGNYPYTIVLDASNNIESFVDPEGFAWHFTYDGESKPLTVISPHATGGVPATWTYTYDSNGYLETVTNPRGYITTFVHNSAGDVTDEIADFNGDGTIDGHGWHATYSVEGDLETVMNPRGTVYFFTYDTIGQLDKVKVGCDQGSCETADFEFDLTGHPTTVRRRKSLNSWATWTYVWGTGGALQEVTDPTGWTRTFAYDNSGLLAGVSDPAHGSTLFEYTPAYRLSAITDALGARTSFSYDENGNLTTLTDPFGAATTFTYEKLNRLESRTDPLGRAWLYRYDKTGNLTRITYPNSDPTATPNPIEMGYDEVGRLVSRTYPDTSEDLYSRDENGNVTQVSRTRVGQPSDSVNVTYLPNDLPGSIMTTFPDQGASTSGATLRYDPNGNLISMTPAPYGHWYTIYEYDDLDHVSNVTYWSASNTHPSYSYSYDPWTQRRTSFPMGRHANALRYTAFDDAGRVLQFMLSQGEPDDGTYDLGYDGTTKQVVSVTWTRLENSIVMTTTRTFEYDAIGRLIREVEFDGTQHAYRYDSLGRRISAETVTAEGVSRQLDEYQYNGAGELTSVDAGSERVTYSYEYSATAAALLAIMRSHTGAESSTKRIEMGYDSRLSRVYSIDATTGGETLEESYLWSPFATAQVEAISTRGAGGAMQHLFVLDGLAGPAISSANIASPGTTDLIWYDQSAKVDQLRSSGLFAPEPVRGLADREHFHLFARRAGLDPTSALGGPALALSGTRSSAFAGVGELLGQLVRRDEVQPYYGSFGALDTLPAPIYIDEDTDLPVASPGMDVPLELGGARGGQSIGDGTFGLGGRTDTLGLGVVWSLTSGGTMASGWRGIPIIGPKKPGDRVSNRLGLLTANLSAGTPNDFEDHGTNNPPPVKRRGSCGPLGASCNAPGCGLLPYDPRYDKKPDQGPYRNEATDAYNVNPYNGEYVLSVTDLDLPWPGMPFHLTRTYRSHSVGTNELGRGWSHNYGERLLAPVTGSFCSTVNWIRSDQWSGVFVWHEELGRYTGPGGLVLRPCDGSSVCHGFQWVLRLPDGELHYFGSNGYLARVEDRFGNFITFQYNTLRDSSNTGYTRLVSVRGMFNQKVVFSYRDAQTQQGLDCKHEGCPLVSITDCDMRDLDPDPAHVTCQEANARSVKYNYTSNTVFTKDLMSVTSPAVGPRQGGPPDWDGDTDSPYPNGKTTSYTYLELSNDSSHHYLASIRDGVENASNPVLSPFVSVSYVESTTLRSRTINAAVVKDITFANSANKVRYDYTSSITTVLDRLNRKTEYTVAAGSDRRIETVYLNGTVTIVDEDSFDDDGNRLESKSGKSQNNAIHWEQYAYDTYGNLLEKRVKADGVRTIGPDPGSPTTGPDLVTRYTYEPVYQQLRTTTEPRAFPNGNVPVEYYDFSDPLVRKATTWRYFDYQEAAPQGYVEYLHTWGLDNAPQLPTLLADLNGDGITTVWAGGVVMETHDLKTDADHPGSLNDVLVTRYQLNQKGQPKRTETAMEDATTRVTTYVYGEAGIESGQLVSKTVEVGSGQDMQTTYAHDQWGNVISERDGRGVETRYDINALNQVYRIVKANSVNGGGLTALQYYEETRHDANNRVSLKRVENIHSPRSFVEISYGYDALDRKTSETVHVDGRDRVTSYVYDAEGQLVKTVFPAGNAETYTYDLAGRRTEVRRHARRATSRTDSSVINDDSHDSVTTTTYDGRGNVVSVIEPYDATNYRNTTIAYDGYDRKMETSRWLDSNGDGATGGPNDGAVKERIYYDVASLVNGTQTWGDGDGTAATLELLARTKTDYDEMGRAFRSCAFLDPNDSVLDSTSAAVSSADPCTLTWYNWAGQARVIQDPNGNQTTIIYDRAGRQKEVHDPLGNVVAYSYDLDSNVTQTTSTERDSDGTTERTYTTTSAYDALGRLTSSRVDPSGLNLETSYQYDPRGNVTAVFDPECHRTETTYNEANQAIETRLCQPVSCQRTTVQAACTGTGQFLERTQYEYDVNGLLYGQTDGNGQQTRFWYDTLNRRAYARYPDNTGVATEYDRAGRTTRVRRQAQIDGAGAYSKDDHFEPTSDPGYQCPTNGSSPCLIDTITYDTLDRVLTKAFSKVDPTAVLGAYGGTTQQTFAYDGLSRVLQTTDNNDPDSTLDDVTIKRSYDSLSRVLEERQQLGVGGTVLTVAPVQPSGTEKYDKNGNRRGLAYPSGLTVTFEADELNRPARITVGGSLVASHTYSGPGLIKARNYGNGALLDLTADGWGYDKAKRITHVKHAFSATPGATQILNLNYGYSPDSLRTFEQATHTPLSGGTLPGQKYTHDGAHRLQLSQEGTLDGSGNIVGQASRSDNRIFDVEGNWKGYQLDADGIPGYEVDGSNDLVPSGQGSGMNQYANFRGSPWTYTFAGALAVDGTQSYHYDALDRLIQVNQAGTVTSYVYDAENRRIAKVGAFTTRYVYDGWRVLEEYTSGTVRERYIWANNIDKLLAFELSSENWATRHYVHGDASGSIRAITSGTTTSPTREAEFRYGAFGEKRLETGSLSACGAGVNGCVMPYRYTAQRFDPESELYYYKNRYYNPTAGRFLTRDPAGYVDGSNLYAYVRNSSASVVDPTGLQASIGVDREQSSDARMPTLQQDWNRGVAGQNQFKSDQKELKDRLAEKQKKKEEAEEKKKSEDGKKASDSQTTAPKNATPPPGSSPIAARQPKPQAPGSPPAGAPASAPASQSSGTPAKFDMTKFKQCARDLFHVKVNDFASLPNDRGRGVLKVTLESGKDETIVSNATQYTTQEMTTKFQLPPGKIVVGYTPTMSPNINFVGSDTYMRGMGDSGVFQQSVQVHEEGHSLARLSDHFANTTRPFDKKEVDRSGEVFERCVYGGLVGSDGLVFQP